MAFGERPRGSRRPGRALVGASLLAGSLLGLWEGLMVLRSGLGPEGGVWALLALFAGIALLDSAAVFLGGLLLHLPFWLLGRKLRHRRSLSLAPALLLALAVTVRYTTAPGVVLRAPVGRELNVLLVSIDTLRADALGAYGNPLARTPVIDGLSRRGLLCAEVICPVPMTTPSHGSMLTATIPAQHGASGNAYRLGPENESLAEILLACGYQTEAIVSCFPLDRKFGLDQGFLGYEDGFQPRGGIWETILGSAYQRWRHRGALERPGAATTYLARRWLGANAGRSFFLFLHYFDPHAPYAPPESYRRAFDGLIQRHDDRWPAGMQREDVIRAVDGFLPASWDADLPEERYLAEVSYSDRQLGEVLRALADQTAGETLIVVTSDHGESLGEHGEVFSHGATLFEPVLRVPLILSGPSIPEGRLLGAAVRLIDLAPTILEVLELKPGEPMQGESILGMAAAPAPVPRPAAIENLGIVMIPGAVKQKGYRTPEWKLVQREDALGRLCDSGALYDLASDPLELRDVCGEEPETGAALQREMLAAFSAAIRLRQAEGEVLDDEETLEKLEALGYL
jgi:arylsulfatase A-like enzyme